MTSSPTLSIIVPTLNEAGNIPPLLQRLGEALAGINFEVVFVDDSSDNTPTIIAQEQESVPFPIYTIVRPPERRNGLSGAVVEGFAAVHGTWMCVMDGDLQHPPEVIPQMLALAHKTGADMVVGSRRASVLGPMGLSLFRTLVSQVLTITARALFPRSLKDVSDPLTGLFLVKREMVIVDRLRPNGFKILLEILVRCPYMRISEVYFDFAHRQQGESKADVQEGMRFFRHLLNLRITAHQRPLGHYLAVAAVGLLINIAVIVGIVSGLGWWPLLGVILATEASDLWRYWGNRRFVFPPDEAGDGPFQRYFTLNQVFLFLLRLPLFYVLFTLAGLNYIIANLLAIFMSGIVRYMLSDRWIWTRSLIAPRQPAFFYNVHGLLRIESPVGIPHLAYFDVPELETPADIQIRLDRHGTPRQLHDAISYDERLGRLGFAMTVLPSNNDGMAHAEAVISPLIENSPFVLYHNIVEPLIRWMLLQRGYVLIQAGAVVSHGRTQLFTASLRPTITQAVLETLQADPEARYLSHELTIVRPDGYLLSFPTPVTTRKALEATWIRRIGAGLRRWTLPAATFHTVAQRIWPPTQLPINALVSHARPLDQAPVGDVTAIDLTISSNLPADLLLKSAEDAYMFPLYGRLLTTAGAIHGPAALTRERDILVAAWQSKSDAD